MNLEDKSEIVAFDSNKLSVTSHWPLAPGESPTGLAMDVAHKRLFSGCRGTKTMVVMDADNGKIVASLPIGAGVDATGFDPDSQNAFSSNGDGTVTVVHEEDPATFKVVQNVATQAGAKTLAMDEKNHHVLLVTATLQDAKDPNEEQNRQHKTVTPGTFAVLIVGK